MSLRSAFACVVCAAVLLALGVHLLRGNEASVAPQPESHPDDAQLDTSGPYLSAEGTSPLVAPTKDAPSPATPGKRLLRVLVTDDENRGVANATILVMRPDADPLDLKGVLTRGTTNGRGQADLSWPDLPVVSLSAIARGFKTAHAATWDAAAATEWRVRLAAGHQVRGRILDGSGAPVADATVVAIASELPLDPSSATALPKGEFLNRGATTSAENGTFVVGGLSADATYTLSVQKEGYAPAFDNRRPLDGIRPGGEPVVVRLLPAYRLAYRIVDGETDEIPVDPVLATERFNRRSPADSARAGGLPGVPPSAAFPWICDEIWTSDSAEDSLGPFTVTVLLTGYEPLEATVTARRWSTAEPVVDTLRLKRNSDWQQSGRLKIQFRQMGDSAKPVVSTGDHRHHCLIRRVDDPAGSFRLKFVPDDSGNILIERMPPGRWRLTTRLGLLDRKVQAARNVFDVHEDRLTTHTVLLPPVGSLSIDLPKGASPPSHATLMIKEAGSTQRPWHLFAQYFRHGSLIVPLLPVGKYEVTVRAQGFSDDPVTVAVAAGAATHIEARAQR